MSTIKKEIDQAGGLVSSSEIDDFAYITTHSLQRLAYRCKIGVQRKGDKAWNATTSNHDCLTNIDFAINRISHVIGHALALRDKLVKAKHTGEFHLDKDHDDAAAIMWSGMLFCEVTNAIEHKEHKEHKIKIPLIDCEACGGTGYSK